MTEQKLKELRKYFKPHEKAFIMAAISFLTVEEIASTLGKSKIKIQSYIKCFGEDHLKLRMKQMFSEAKLQKWIEGDLPSFKSRSKKRSNKRNVAGIRQDLGLYMRSKMEANLARVLTKKYGRKAWEYECKLFDLGEFRGKKKRYLPDFHVTLKDGTEFWIEVKGRFFPGDILKMKRFFKAYPDHRVVMMTCRNSKKVKEFAEKQKLETWIYEDLRDDYSDKISGWE